MAPTIFRNRITGKTFLYLPVFCIILGAVLVYVDDGKDSLSIIGVTLGVTVLLVLLLWIAFHFSSRSLIAELILRGDTLEVEMVHVLGKGRKFELPIPPASDWGWYSQKADSKSTERVGVITFKSGDRKYQMSLDGAEVVDEVELRRLAPQMVDELTASSLLFHKPA